MARWFLVALSLLLAGCATHRDYYYNDGYYADEGYYDRYRYSGDSYYAPGYGGSGDYWYGEYDDYRYSGYLHYPSYYSVYWPMHRWYHDPYWYPGFYYGVTFFPRNYLSLGISYGWPRYGSWFAYSPYRYGWSDWYYDWYPYYAYYPRYRDHYHLPRHGSARAEAERLSRLVDGDRFAAKRGDALLPRAGRGSEVRGVGRDGRTFDRRAGMSEARALPDRGGGARALPARGVGVERGDARGVERGATRGVDRGIDRDVGRRMDRGRIDAEPVTRSPALRESRRLPVETRRGDDDGSLRRTLREEGVPLRTRTRTVTIEPREAAPPRAGVRDYGRVYERREEAYRAPDRGGYDRGDYGRGRVDRGAYGGGDYRGPVPQPLPARGPAPVQREFAREAPPQYRAPAPSYSPPPAREAPPSRGGSIERHSEPSPSSRGERGARGSVRER